MDCRAVARPLTYARLFRVEPSPLGRIVVASEVPAGFALFYTTMDFDGALTVPRAETIEALLRQRFGIAATLATCTQVHGKNVRRVVPRRDDEAPSTPADDLYHDCGTCDALWAAGHGIALGVKVADCLPVTFIDAAHGVIANVHSGWRGAVQRIAEGTLDATSGRLDPATARAYFGPSIRACCFEVGDEVVEQFRAVYAGADRWIDTSHAKAHIDLAGLTREQLLARGFHDANIVDSRLCTRCDGSIFHSYRRDGKGGGRNLAIVAA